MTTSLWCKSEKEEWVVEAYRLDRYDNFEGKDSTHRLMCCRSLSFG